MDLLFSSIFKYKTLLVSTSFGLSNKRKPTLGYRNIQKEAFMNLKQYKASENQSPKDMKT